MSSAVAISFSPALIEPCAIWKESSAGVAGPAIAVAAGTFLLFYRTRLGLAARGVAMAGALTSAPPPAVGDRVRVLGPVRNESQVEISRTEEFKLGIDAPIRASGDLAGASSDPGLYDDALVEAAPIILLPWATRSGLIRLSTMRVPVVST